jgi:hypothetical protein
MIQLPIDKTHYEEIAAQIWQQYGVEIAAPNGVIEKNGISATYSYDGTMFTATVTHAPFPLSEKYCETRIQEWLTEKIAA